MGGEGVGGFQQPSVLLGDLSIKIANTFKNIFINIVNKFIIFCLLANCQCETNFLCCCFLFNPRLNPAQVV